ncbi:MAG: NAD-dependent epimerase/dehydratase family protein [Desulfovibrio sp.]|nr:NAD-dependent epimerase/dehydratase family protein [Desulfovibrio sp.]
MKILIIGGAEFIGPVVARHLANAGHDITVFHRTPAPQIPYPQIAGDCESVDQLYKGMQSVQPDAVVHTTALCGRQVKAVEQALAGRKTRMILLSSVDVYKAFEVVNRLSDAPVQSVPLHERSPLRDVLYPYRGRRPDTETAHDMQTLHDYEKITVERAALESSVIDAVILRLGMVYGRNDYNHRFGEPVRKMYQGDKFIELPQKVAEFRACKCFVEDIAHGVRLAVESDVSGEIYNLAAQEVLSEMEWYQRTAELMNWKGTITVSEESGLTDSFNPEQHLVVDTAKIRKELHYKELFSVQEGLRHTIQWELENVQSY